MATKKKGRTRPHPSTPTWGPWVRLRADPLPDPVQRMMFPADKYIWKNGMLSVMVEQEQSADPTGPIVLHLSFRRDDRKPMRDWRHVQRMKSELCGSDTEGIELYPHEERVLDAANQYHLYVLPPGLTWPVGIRAGRNVADNAMQRKLWEDAGMAWDDLGGQQRDFEDGVDAWRYAEGKLRPYYPEWANWAMDRAHELLEDK